MSKGVNKNVKNLGDDTVGLESLTGVVSKDTISKINKLIKDEKDKEDNINKIINSFRNNKDILMGEICNWLGGIIEVSTLLLVDDLNIDTDGKVEQVIKDLSWPKIVEGFLDNSNFNEQTFIEIMSEIPGSDKQILEYISISDIMGAFGISDQDIIDFFGIFNVDIGEKPMFLFKYSKKFNDVMNKPISTLLPDFEISNGLNGARINKKLTIKNIADFIGLLS